MCLIELLIQDKKTFYVARFLMRHFHFRIRKIKLRGSIKNGVHFNTMLKFKS